MALPDDVLDQLLAERGEQDLFGPTGLIKELTGRLLERALETELTHHLGYEKHHAAAKQTPNSRNGHSKKTLKGEEGTLEVRIPRDRDGTFEPQLIPKRSRRLPGFDEKIIALYGSGMSVRQIQEHVEDLYEVEISRDLICSITDAVLDDVKAWQARPLEAQYPIVYLDALFVKVRRTEGIRKQAVYVALGITREGRKEVLGLWMAAQEKASFWLNVLTALKNRGVDDVLYFAVDGLKGFEEAIEALYPQAIVQQCIVHLVRNSTRYVSRADRKAVCASLRAIYTAPTADAALAALEAAKIAWPKYPHLTRPWEAAWERVIPFFSFPPGLRKVLYTTNAIESLNRQLRRVLKTRGAFPTEESVYKVLYLAIDRASRNWTREIVHWREALLCFEILFPNRLTPST